MNFLQLNLRILKVYNSCDTKSMVSLFGDAISEPNYRKLFTRKYYIWNIFRMKDFYKAAAQYVINMIDEWKKTESLDDDSYQEKVDRAITIILETAKNDEIRKSFIWAITKKHPLITISTIRYSSSQRITNILNSDQAIITDEYTKPMLDMIKNLKEENEMLRAENSAVHALAEEI